MNKWPLSHRYFVAAQRVVCEHFNKALKFRWAEGIYRHVNALVKQEFDYQEGTALEEENIDRGLLRLFAQIRLSMQAVLKDSLVTALSQFLEFLLGFHLRDQNSKRSRVSHDVHLSPHFRLPSTLKHFAPAHPNNDLEMVPLHRTPFLKMQVIATSKKPQNLSPPKRNQSSLASAEP